jgi:hypothetical protein
MTSSDSMDRHTGNTKDDGGGEYWPQERLLPPEIEEGMQVYDCMGRRVGVVEEVFAGQGDGGEDELFDEQLSGTLLADPNLPISLRGHLLRYGYIGIELGPLHGRRYATAKDVEAVHGRDVTLVGSADDLLAL